MLFVARGTSDHAALYGKYLTEIIWQLPAGLASPSTMTTYGARPDLSGVLVIGVSQSGGSPDLVQTLTVARQQGACTVAVTNAARSPLATAAEHHIDVLAGPELAVAATKSYTAQLLALYLLLTDVAGRDNTAAALLPSVAKKFCTAPSSNSWRLATDSPHAWSPPDAATPIRLPARLPSS